MPTLFQRVRLELTQVNSSANRKLHDEEVAYFVQKAIERFITTKVKRRANSELEWDIIEAEAINPYIVSERKTTSSETITLPENHSLIVSISVKKSNNQTIPVRLLPSAKFDLMSSLPYWGSNATSWIAKYTGKTILITPHKKQDVIKETNIVYIKKIGDISVTNQETGLNDLYIGSIVDLAVLIGKELLNDPTWQVKERDNQRNITIN